MEDILYIFIGTFLSIVIVYLFFRLAGKAWYKSKKEEEFYNGKKEEK